MPNKTQERLREADVQLLLVSKEEEEQEWSSPELLHVKEEEEEVWGCGEAERLRGPEDPDVIKFTFIPVTVKSEEDDEEKPLSSQLYDTEEMKSEADEEDCGGAEPDRSFSPGSRLQTESEDETSDVSEPERGVIGDWKKSRPPSALSSLQYKSGVNAGDVSFSCFDCGKRFCKPSNLKRHMRIHTGEKPFTCLFCGARFTRKEILRQHMRIHTGDKPFCCSVCNKTFIQKVQLTRHMALHTGEKRPSWSVCEKASTEADGEDCGRSEGDGNPPLNPRSKPDAGAESSDFPESETDDSDDWKKKSRQLPSGSNSVKNPRRRNAGEKSFRCSDCGKQFSQKGNLKRHVRIHTGEKPFTCLVCSTSFVQKVQLMHHMVRHTGEKRYRCALCCKRFTWLYQLKKHLRAGRQSSERRRSRTEEDRESLGGSRPEPEPETDDSQETRKSQSGVNHVQNRKVAVSDMEAKTGEASVSSPEGVAIFHQKEQQQRRCGVRTGLGPSQREGDAARPLRIHTGDRPFSCSVCRSAFTHRSSLTAHSRLHRRRKHFRCSVCKATFRYSCNLFLHVRVHSGEKGLGRSVGWTQDSSETPPD